jgi:hypothetical protein
LFVQPDNIVGIHTKTLCQAYPEEQHIGNFDPGVLQIVQAKSFSLLCFLTPVFPEGAVSQFLEFVAHGSDIVVQPDACGLRVEIFSESRGIETGSFV